MRNRPVHLLEKFDREGHKLAKGLGVFSVVLGLSEILMPKFLARNLGLGGQHAVLRGYGLRELITGWLILAVKNPMPWVWTRVAGDVIDAATLGLADHSSPRSRKNIVIALAALGGVAAADILCATILSAQADKAGKSIQKLVD